MEREVLRKIYTLRKIGPDKDWKDSAKKSILSEGALAPEAKKATIWDHFGAPVSNSGLALAGAFAFLFIFASLAFPLFPDYDYERKEVVVDLPMEVAKEDEGAGELKEVAQSGDEENREKVQEKNPIEKDLASVEDSYREIQREVLGTLVMSGIDGVEGDLTDKEIAEYLVEEMEGESKEDAGEEIVTMMTEESEEDDDKEHIQEAKEALENEDYEKVFDIYITHEYN